MFIITPRTVSSKAALEFRQIPRRFIGRSFVWPRGGGWRLKARVIFEVELLRYLVALAPFAGLALLWRESALAIAQAPALMVLVIYGVEMRFLRLTPAARAALMDAATRDRMADLLAARGRAILTQIGAGRRLSTGALHLVVEQSELARVAPLTFVTVQSDDGPALLDLTAEEQALIRAELFAPPLTEAEMQRLTLARKDTVSVVSLEMRAISAHARMRALTKAG
ncbi:hypothetical protein [Pseudorhodobacter sp. MZDSW-24AT]|uniref:hypothetical protein n=1 Tax=Pseudorhodobacter sp. MZDSW-24AT TaxID=2052957 RepID=UPI000C1F0142|nr:hypothetical protein [Pseudorhodobacter sp. MZDSW-24AT]PJF11165.1 hypothetical protein CUR21_00710 [Pseudorhodobacter sp. MZDSW-24AT]